AGSPQRVRPVAGKMPASPTARMAGLRCLLFDDEGNRTNKGSHHGKEQTKWQTVRLRSFKFPHVFSQARRITPFVTIPDGMAKTFLVFLGWWKIVLKL
ncbi:MAG: hypothetical protein WA849_02760, partial [Candidatus Udaeobacter sp.]